MRQEISSKRVISIIVVIVSMVVLYPQWQALRQMRGLSSVDKNQPSCLKVSDFYAVQLTTYSCPPLRTTIATQKTKHGGTTSTATGFQGREKSFSRSISWSKTRETNPWCFRSRVTIWRDILRW